MAAVVHLQVYNYDDLFIMGVNACVCVCVCVCGQDDVQMHTLAYDMQGC